MTTRRIGVILAAGRGRRMGRTKQLIPWPSDGGERPLIAAAYDAICPICDDMVIVLGHEADAIVAALGQRKFRRATCDPDAPMFNSIRAGLEAALLQDPTAVVVLQPADHPEVKRSTLAELAEWSLRRPTQAVIPEFRGRGGHPILVPPVVNERVTKSSCPAGLGQFLAAHPELCVRIPVTDAAVVRDIDTPADLGTNRCAPQVASQKHPL